MCVFCVIDSMLIYRTGGEISGAVGGPSFDKDEALPPNNDAFEDLFGKLQTMKGKVKLWRSGYFQWKKMLLFFYYFGLAQRDFIRLYHVRHTKRSVQNSRVSAIEIYFFDMLFLYSPSKVMYKIQTTATDSHHPWMF